MAAPDQRGFSLVEVLIATAILASSLVVLLNLASTGQRLARALPDAADMQQRLRVAADMIQRDLLMAGAGLVHGTAAGPLVDHLPPILPMRTGARNADPELSFFSDRITVLYLPEAAASAPLAMDMHSAAADIPVDRAAPGCPGVGLCGFEDGTRALVVPDGGPGLGFELFSVAGTAAGLRHTSPDPPFSRSYPATARVMQVRQRVYYLDAATRRLMSYDGYQTDVPLAENIVLLKFEYLLEASPGSVARPPDGEGNCLYAAASPPVPLLADLGGPLPAPAGSALLTDGPVCGLAPQRFDGDLLRIRRVRVSIRAQVADHALRGAGSDFATPGVSSSGEGYVPDIAVTFDVTPRNMTATR